MAWKGVGEALMKVKKRFAASGAVGYNNMMILSNDEKVTAERVLCF